MILIKGDVLKNLRKTQCNSIFIKFIFVLAWKVLKLKLSDKYSLDD